MGLRVTFPEGQSQRFFFQAPSSALWLMPLVYFDVLYFLHPCGLHLVMDLWKEK